ncbi:NmrA family NAD(P)-binding protein [Streptomyces sp. NPDC004749]
MTALVAGGTGAMGTRVARALAARTGTVVRVLTRDPCAGPGPTVTRPVET